MIDDDRNMAFIRIISVVYWDESYKLRHSKYARLSAVNTLKLGHRLSPPRVRSGPSSCFNKIPICCFALHEALSYLSPLCNGNILVKLSGPQIYVLKCYVFKPESPILFSKKRPLTVPPSLFCSSTTGKEVCLSGRSIRLLFPVPRLLVFGGAFDLFGDNEKEGCKDEVGKY